MSKTVKIAVDNAEYHIELPNVDTDYIQGKIATEHQPYELAMLRDIASRLGEGSVVLDVGANIGNHALYLAAVSGCKVYAFEPNADLCLAFRESIKKNNLGSRVKVYQNGVGAEEGKAHFININKENLGAQSLDVSNASGDHIDVITIDKTIKEKVDVVKIDVEGMELDVLKGAQKTIEKYLPLIYVESLTEQEFNNISALLVPLGYCYWDTFNATPTHLFLHSSIVTQEQRFERLLLKSAREEYRAAQTVIALREKLAEANAKYRIANEKIHDLKEKLDSANTKYRDSSSALVALKKKHEEDCEQYTVNIADIETRILVLEKELESKSQELKTSDAARKDLEVDKTDLSQHRNELLSQVSSLAEKYEAANKNYLQALERLNGLQRDAIEEGKKHHQEKLKLSASVEEIKQSTGAVIEELKSEAVASQERLASLHDELNSERTIKQSLLDQVAGLYAQNQILQEQHAKEQKDLEELTQQNEALLEKLLLLQKDNRTLQEQFEKEIKYSNELSQENSSLLDKVQLLNEKNEGADRRVVDITNSLKKEREVKSELESQIQELTQKLGDALHSSAQVNEQLSSANLKYRHITGTEVPTLKQRIGSLQEKCNQLENELKDVSSKRIAAEKRVLELRSSLTFKTGYLIRNQSRSLLGIFKIPIGLWRIYQQDRKRARQKSQKQPHQPQQTKFQLKTASVFQEAQPLGVVSENVLPTNAPARQLRMACIMDDFTYTSYQPECELQQLTPDNWQAELEAFKPQVLFIESAWRGKDELWGSKVGHKSKELQGIVAWCKTHSIPTLFWNKEDPVHFETFLSTAKLFDYVFTTDIDCIHRYKAALGHERVYLLPFACQPTQNNPIEKYQRKDAFCFAGAYYVRYPHRTQDLETYVAELPGFRPLEIYDRNYGKNDPNYQFPEHYQPYIVGTLPFSEIDKAYKGYRYAINLNSIKQSQTMFARRVFELLGSNTLTISNFSRGVRLLFGDLVITSDSGGEVVNRLDKLAADPSIEDRVRLAALRKVMREHTYGHRLDYVIDKIGIKTESKSTVCFTVVSLVKDENEITSVIANARRQRDVQLRLLLVLKKGLSESVASSLLKHSGMQGRVVPIDKADANLFVQDDNQIHWVAVMAPADYYGPHYLLDIAVATQYSQASVIGKATHYQWRDNELKLLNPDKAYRAAPELPKRSAAILSDQLLQVDIVEWLNDLYDGWYTSSAQLAIDPYNYCRDAISSQISQRELKNYQHQELIKTVDDLPLNEGISLADLLKQAESIHPLQNSIQEETPTYAASALNQIFGKQGNKLVSMSLGEDGLQIISTLDDGKHEYFYARQDLPRAELMQGQEKEDELKIYLDMEPGLNLSLVILFLDAEGQRVSHVILSGNRNHSVNLPLETASVRLGWRVYSGGQTVVKRLILGHRDLQPARVLGQQDILLLTNHYPSYEDLYRNGFVHSRVKSYKEHGVGVDIFRLRKNEPVSWHEFENIDVTTGSQEALRRMLSSGSYHHVLVHFLDPDMWEVLSEHIDSIKVTVWVHGAEIHPWYRRKFNIETPEQEEIARLQSDQRMEFWRGLLNPMPKGLKLIFVSKIFSEEVMEDLGFRLPEDQYEIIHNPIDTDLFTYQRKDTEQRKKILSIRPYASRQYANDVMVAAILELSKKSFFGDLQFRIIGDGKLFEETLEPLREFRNIQIEKRFLNRLEIATIHKNYGVFICPTRWDSQGVSRDEAMSSGLIPITNIIAAVPEFVDEASGILVEQENAQAIAQAVEEIYFNQERFSYLSKGASAKVRSCSDKNRIVLEELASFTKIPNCVVS